MLSLLQRTLITVLNRGMEVHSYYIEYYWSIAEALSVVFALGGIVVATQYRNAYIFLYVILGLHLALYLLYVQLSFYVGIWELLEEKFIFTKSSKKK